MKHQRPELWKWLWEKKGERRTRDSELAIGQHLVNDTVFAESEQWSTWAVPEGITEADVTGADPPQENIAVPLGVAGGDGGLAIRVALNIKGTVSRDRFKIF